MLDLIRYFGSFIFVITILVFVHEFGHYYIAKLCGVRVTKFSIGMGKSFFTRTDKSGTEWCLSWLPLGGYVKMFGDENVASTPDFSALDKMSTDERKFSFHYKNVWQKLAIVFAGPLSNYLFAIILLAGLSYFSGTLSVSPIISAVIADSPASESGLLVGDKIISMDEEEISQFSDIHKFIMLHNSDQIIALKVKRDDEFIELKIAPKMREIIDDFGDKRQLPFIGIVSTDRSYKQYGIFDSLAFGVRESYDLSKTTLTALYQMITGKRSYKEIGGPISVAKYSGKTSQMGFKTIIWFLAVLSVNLGLMNLLPIPMLDGGHILFYMIEIISGKPLKKSIQEYGSRVGFILLFSLMIFATMNDFVSLIWGK